MDDLYVPYPSATECFADLRRKFEELEVFSADNQVVPSCNAGDDRFNGIVRSLGWPPAPDGNGWDKEVGLKEVERVWPEFE